VGLEAQFSEPAGSSTTVGMPTPVVFSWSAGKDSAFGLWTLLGDPGFEVRALLTTLTEGYNRVSMSGVRDELLDRQADALGLPLIKVWIPPQCANEVYQQRMGSTLAAAEFRGIKHVAFADLFLEDVRTYREGRLAGAGMQRVFPLWGRDTAALALEMIAGGFRAIVVCVDPRALDPSFAGRAFDQAFITDLPPGVDPCGENGEFHTWIPMPIPQSATPSAATPRLPRNAKGAKKAERRAASINDRRPQRSNHRPKMTADTVAVPMASA